jgi:uncharacterized LabA/DUF88 family protein
MASEPSVKRAIAFFDGQNLFYAVKHAFGYSYPNYDPLALTNAICKAQKWDLVDTYFYTGIPDAADNPTWNHFWTAKLAVMGTRGIKTFSRPLKYRNQSITLPDGKTTTFLVGQEKGVDVRICLDIVRMAREKTFDVALLFSQDQDLSEVADEIKNISVEQDRWIQLACAFPVSPAYKVRGIRGTYWINIDRTLYGGCLDPNDYRPKTKK